MSEKLAELFLSFKEKEPRLKGYLVFQTSNFDFFNRSSENVQYHI